jgi:hypothetical protein
MKHLKYFPGALFAVVTAATAINGCAAAKDAEGAAQGCSGLNVQVSAQAAVKAFAEAAADLQTAAAAVEAKYLVVCNKMNASLGLDTSKTTAKDACAVLQARVQMAAAAGVTVQTDIAFNCTADVKAQASCEGTCNASAMCDVKAQCEPGKLVVDCAGTCDATCDVQAPSFACSGMCQGTCTATAAVACMGSCEGTCDAPTFDGTCDAGCTANFSGTCGGMCMGTCDGVNSTATCEGKCVGTCSAKASGHCEAKCTGTFKGGCMGMCTGSCSATGAIACNGQCNGTCSYTPGQATCMGECHGNCSVESSPPRCTGMLNCTASADCRGSCQADASAHIDCSHPQATVTVVGDLKLQQAIEANLDEWAEAFNLTLALKDPAAKLAAKTAAGFQALGDVGAAGLTCAASGITAAASASASVSVSVSASASLKTN